MKSPFDNHMTTGLRRLLCIIAVIVLLTATLAGCGKKAEEEQTIPSNNSMLDLEEDPTESTEEPLEESTDPTEETLDPDLLNIRSAPTMDSGVIGHLQPGDEINILREEEVGGIRWALIREGWICIEYLEKYTGPDGIIIAGSSANETEPGETETTPTTATTGNNGNGGNNGNNGNGGNNGTTGTGTGTAADITGTITATELNIRQSPDTNGERVGVYKRGDVVKIVETKNGWGRTDKGWISMEYVYQLGATGKNPCNGVITGDGLNIRSGPGTNHNSVGSYGYGDRIRILERIQIGDTWWGATSKGWISMGYVYVDGTKGEGAGFGSVTGDAVNVRSGPGTQFDAVGSKNYGNDVEIFFQIKINDTWWGCIGDGKWISMDFVGMG